MFAIRTTIRDLMHHSLNPISDTQQNRKILMKKMGLLNAQFLIWIKSIKKPLRF